MGSNPATIVAGDDTIAKIQGKIDVANIAIIKAAGVVTTTGIDKAKLADSKTLIATYAPVDDKGVITDATIKGYPATIDIQLALVDVINATTPTTLKAKLTALKALDVTLDMTKYVDANGKDYITKIALPATAKAVTADINTAIGAVNTANAASLLTAVATAAAGTDADVLLKALNDLGLKQVATTNKAQYVTTADAAAFVTAAGKAITDVQGQVDISNLAVITTATDADTLLTALKVLELKNVVDANKAAYLTDVKLAGTATIKTNAATMDAALKAINTKVLQDAQVKVINEAKDAMTISTALLALGEADYLNIPSVDRLGVASAVLVLRDATVTTHKFADLSKVQAALTTATGAHDTALKGVNDLTAAKTITEVSTVLKAVGNEAFNAMTTAEQATIAENFKNGLKFDATVGRLKVSPAFTTLQAIIALMK